MVIMLHLLNHLQVFYLKIPSVVSAHNQSQQHFQYRHNDGFYCNGLSAVAIDTRTYGRI